MATTLEYITYTNGEVARKVLNTVATFCSSPSFDSMQQIALMIGLTVTLYQYSISRDHAHLIKWVAVCIALPLFLINMTARMQIIDKTEPAYSASVDNVPYIVALPAHYMGLLMSGLTESVETIMALPDDERFGRTGMMFGSRLYRLSEQSSLRTVVAQGIWNDFFNNCIVGDIEINHKYTWEGLLGSADIFGFLDTQTMSPLRAIILPDGTYKTCQEAYPDIKTTFQDDAQENINLLGSYLYGDKASTQLNFLKNALSDSHDQFIGYSRDSVDILKHNMAMNAIRSSVNVNDHSAVGMNYAYTSNKMQTTAMWANIGLQAKEFVPMLHTIFFLMFSVFGFVVVIVALIPRLTAMVLGNYFKTFATLALYPFIFAVLNSIMNWSLEATTVGYANDFGGITMTNSNALDEMHTRFAAIAGYLMMSTPLIAASMFKGGAAMMGSLNYGLAGMINSVNARTSGAMATGDISHGNTAIDTHQSKNVTSNKIDTANYEKTFGDTVQQSDGSFRTDYGGGNTVYDQNPSVSNFTWGMNATSAMQEATRNEYQSSQQNLQNWNNQVGESNTLSAGMLQNWSYANSDTNQYSTRDAMSTSSSLNTSVSTMQSSLDSISQQEGFSHTSAVNLANGFSGSIGAGASTPSFQVFDAKIGANANISAENRESWDKLDQESKQQVYQDLVQYNSSASKVNDIAHSEDASSLNADTQSWLRNWSSNYQNTQTAMSNVSAAHQKTEQLAEINSRLEQDGTQISENLVPRFQQYVEDNARNKDEATSILTAQSGDGAEKRRAMMDDYLSSGQFLNDVANIPTEDQMTQRSIENAQNMSPTQWQNLMQEGERQKSQARYEQKNERANETFESQQLMDYNLYKARIAEAQAKQPEVDEKIIRQSIPYPEGEGVPSQVNAQLDTTPIGRVAGDLVDFEKPDWEAEYGQHHSGKQR